MRNIILCLALVTSSSLANANCQSIRGYLTQAPLPDCSEVANIPGMQNLPFVGECFKSELKLQKQPIAYGYSGVTSEELYGQFGTTAYSPAIAMDGRSLLTVRSTFSLGGTRFYTSEVLIANGDAVIEQSVITATDGKGQYKNATGSFTILGNSTIAPAYIFGEICK